MCCNVSRHFALLLSQLSWQRRNGDQFSWENPGTEDKKITAVTASSGFSQNSKWWTQRGCRSSRSPDVL